MRVYSRVLACVLGVALAAGSGQCEGVRSKAIADMEGKTVFGVAGEKGKPEVSFSRRIASQGLRSMRFEYPGKGRDRGSITFPVGGAEGFNAIAFDIYCERYNDSSLIVSIRQSTGEKGKAARYKAVLKMTDFIDGWTSVRLVRDAALVFKQDGGVEPDWSKIRTVSFSLAGTMSGTGVYYLDDVRFEDVSGGRSTFNMLYNSSFEIATNPDVPDGWTRDLAIPPYGPEVWSADSGTSLHGDKSLRIGVAGKYARSWGRHTRVVQGRDYTFSAYLKAGTKGTKAELSVSGVGRAFFEVGTDWTRYWVTGKATRTDTVAYVWLKSPGVLWVDATQLELGAEATAYSPAAADSVRPDEIVAKRQTLAPDDARAVEVPSVTAKTVSSTPTIDGDLVVRRSRYCGQGRQY